MTIQNEIFKKFYFIQFCPNELNKANFVVSKLDFFKHITKNFLNYKDSKHVLNFSRASVAVEF
jgi:hypothetical protein